MKKLAFIITHPIQYHSPLFQLMTERDKVAIKVFYTKPPETKEFDPAFGQKVSWDIPLLEGYAYGFLPTDSKAKLQHLIDSLEGFAPAAILIFGWNPPGHLRLMRHFKGKIPLWFRGDSTLLDERPGWRQLARRWFLKWVYRSVDKAFYVGTENKKYFLRHGLRESQLVFAPHAIDNDRFADQGQDYEGQALVWRKELGIAEDDFVILFAGKLEPKKAPQLLLEAIIEINEKKNRAIHLIIAGSGVLKNQLKKLASGLTFIHFIGFQNQSKMPIVYRLGDVFCLPSSGPGETWGLAVNEALASGRPVLTSDKVGCYLDLVIPSKTGLFFPHGNLKALKNRILYMEEKQAIDYPPSGLVSYIDSWSFLEQAKAYEQAL